MALHAFFECVFSVIQLRERVLKLREDHDRIYHLSRTEGKPTVNWGNIMDEKLVRMLLVHLLHWEPVVLSFMDQLGHCLHVFLSPKLKYSEFR